MGRALHKVRVMAVYSPFAAVRPDAFARLSIQDQQGPAAGGEGGGGVVGRDGALGWQLQATAHTQASDEKTSDDPAYIPPQPDPQPDAIQADAIQPDVLPADVIPTGALKTDGTMDPAFLTERLCTEHPSLHKYLGSSPSVRTFSSDREEGKLGNDATSPSDNFATADDFSAAATVVAPSPAGGELGVASGRSSKHFLEDVEEDVTREPSRFLDVTAGIVLELVGTKGEMGGMGMQGVLAAGMVTGVVKVWGGDDFAVEKLSLRAHACKHM
ncbi:hypothetical protein T484DRAFT_1761689 [Baffinella frigidus]|nr:hypothetical protein T484DRAFT_1761689 [Cryptophyta sp. CCMP2293]